MKAGLANKIVDWLLASDAPARLPDIARGVGQSKALVHNALNSLRTAGYVTSQVVAREDRYAVSNAVREARANTTTRLTPTPPMRLSGTAQPARAPGGAAAGIAANMPQRGDGNHPVLALYGDGRLRIRDADGEFRSYQIDKLEELMSLLRRLATLGTPGIPRGRST